MDDQMRKGITHCIESLWGDPCSIGLHELCFWLQPALSYLKQAALQRKLNSVIQNKDPEIRTLAARNFREVYKVCRDAVCLLEDQNPRVIAALIPQVAKIPEIREDLLRSNNSIFQQESSVCRVLMLREFETLPDHVINQWLVDPRSDVQIEVAKYLRRIENSSKFVMHLFQQYREPAPSEQATNWRRDFEILCLPIKVLMRVGDDAFNFAVLRVERHPLKLMKQAAVVICAFGKTDEKWGVRLESFLKELKEKSTYYAELAIGYIERNR
jgi:hypothetical protein